MKYASALLASISCVLTSGAIAQTLVSLPPTATIEIAFSPGNGPPDLIAKAFGEAKMSIHVGTYQLSNGRVINALTAAAKRGVAVHIILDGKTCDAPRIAPVADVLKTNGVPLFCDYKQPIHHWKTAIIDESTLIVGSFNFSPSAQRNAENTNVIRGAPLAAMVHLERWRYHFSNAVPYGSGNPRKSLTTSATP